MRKMKIHLTVLTILTTAWLFSSCTKDESLAAAPTPINEGNQNPNPDLTFRSEGEGGESTYTILGAMRENPFTVANMNTAKTNLYGAGAPAKALPTGMSSSCLPLQNIWCPLKIGKQKNKSLCLISLWNMR